MIIGEPLKSPLRAAVDFILDHPKTAGFLAALALAISLSRKASTMGSWIFLFIALLFAIAMVVGFREKYPLHYVWVCLMVLVVLAILSALGWWLTRPSQEATVVPAKKTTAQLFQECKEAAMRPSSMTQQPSGTPISMPPHSQVAASFAHDANLDKLPEQSNADTGMAACKLEFAPHELTLHDLYLVDFSTSSSIAVVEHGLLAMPKGDGTIVQLDYEIINNLDTAGKFLSFYIPTSKSSYSSCIQVASEYAAALKSDSSIGMATKATGDSEQLDSEHLTFSKRIYLYAEDTLSLRQLARISDVYKKHGISVIVRGIDYVVMRRQAETKQP